VTRLGVAVVVGLLAVLLVDGLTGLFLLLGRSMAWSGAARYEAVLLGAYALTALVSVVLLIIWMVRARKNLDAFPGAAPGWSADWAIAGWFIPCANIVLPFLVMAGIARSSLIRARTRPWIALWWIAYVGAGVLWNAGGALADQRESDAVIWDHREYYASALTGNIISTALLAVATFALATLVVRIGRAQEARIGRARWHAAVSVQPPDGADATIGP